MTRVPIFFAERIDRVRPASEEGSFDDPPDPCKGDEERSGNDDELPILLLIDDPEGGGKGDRDDGNLSEFHADVDPEQAKNERTGGVEPCRHDSGKSETVNEAEDEDNEEPPVAVVTPNEILQGNRDDAGGDDGFHHTRGQCHDASGGKP